MKTLSQWINEAYESYKVENLHIEYFVNNKEALTFKVPSTMSQDAFEIYLQDMYLNELPSGESQSEEKFGNNTEHITDSYFKYDSYEQSDEEVENPIEFDTKISDIKTDDDTEWVYTTIKDVKYVIEFDEFEIQDDKSSDLRYSLINVFDAYSSDNEYPIKIKLDKNNITFDE